MQLVTYTGAIPVTLSTVFRLWTGRGTDRRLTTSMNGPRDKTNIYQAFVEANTTKQVARNKQTISHLRLGLIRLRRCFRNGGILCHSDFCRRRRQHRSSARGTTYCFVATTAATPVVPPIASTPPPQQRPRYHLLLRQGYTDLSAGVLTWAAPLILPRPFYRSRRPPPSTPPGASKQACVRPLPGVARLASELTLWNRLPLDPELGRRNA